MHDIDAYLERIGLRGRPTLAQVHRAHLTSIPFENLDPQRGVPVSLVPEDLERKLVDERRGGYCFEQNLLLKAALEELGAEVELMLARVRVGAPPGAVRPRSHLVLRVEADGWVDLYGFDPEPVPLVDVHTANWFTATHPSSPFVTGLVVAAQRDDGTRTSLSNWSELAFTKQTPAESAVTPIAHDEIPELLASRFDLSGWSLGAEGRVVPATDGSGHAA